MIISGYKHEKKKKKKKKHNNKTKIGKMELILEAVHSDIAFLPVNCFKVLVVRKKKRRGMKATNPLKLYMN